MRPPPLSTRTEATCEVLPLLGPEGEPVWVVIIKQRFVVHRSLTERTPGATVQLVDVPWDPDSPRSSIRYPADLGPPKPGTDVVVVGEAVAPGEAPVQELDVHVVVGPVRKSLKVFGPRVWYGGLGGLSLTRPRPFTRQPLRWEHAFGGMDTADPKRAVQEPRNPLGTGVAGRPETLVDRPAPSIEDPAHLLRGFGNRPPPAGVGALGPQFQQRLQYAGTMNQKWADERCPLPPLDRDPRFFQVATPELIAPVLGGGEQVECVGLSPLGPMRFELPRVAFGVRAWPAGKPVDLRPVLDTVLLEPGVPALELSWKCAVRLPDARTRLEGVDVFEKELLS